ncbi:F-box only protein 15-like isoform X4 [Micropterus dolomieu]|uniref:F-box only protein 15-like isoform X4 n=1 Tax=Micropterus dolomieu TaxID=147949 RepID=UPI001E8DD17F|nr:F-box only protein 15-like isoform X4 [Micropterus dolomieu]
MAAGRGQFISSFLEGLKRAPAQPAPGRPEPGRDRRKPGPGKGQKRGKRRKRPPKAAPCSVSKTDPRCPGKQRTYFPKMKTSPTEEEALLERLPSDILFKILSYLDASSLFCISHVSKLFHQLANNDHVTDIEIPILHLLYLAEFESQTWKPKSADDVAPKVDPVQVEIRSAGHWRNMYFRSMAGQELNKWRKELKDISPYTGLPRQTEWVLRNLNVSWELTVRDCWGKEITLAQSRAYFFESSVIVRFSGVGLLKYHHISKIQLHGVQKDALKGPRGRKPGWRSLISQLDVKTQPSRLIGNDVLIKLMYLFPSFIIGIWRGQNGVAFIMVSLHFHKLVEKCLLGSPLCPYLEPVEPPLVDISDPEFGLHGYSLYFVLHNTGSEIMSGHFRQLSCHTFQIQHGLMELRVISRTDVSQHRSLSGNIKLPWKSETLEGSVEVHLANTIKAFQNLPQNTHLAGHALSGCIILAVSIYLRAGYNISLIANDTLPGVNLMIAIGAIIMVLGFLGCCGAIRENRCMLLLFYINILIIFLLLLAAGLLGAIISSKLDDWVKNSMQNLLPLSSQPANVTADLNSLQQELQCCGVVNGSSDWNNQVPSSCNCNGTQPACSNGVYSTPCSTQIVNVLQKTMQVLLGIAFAIAVFMIFGMVFSMILYCQIGR